MQLFLLLGRLFPLLPRPISFDCNIVVHLCIHWYASLYLIYEENTRKSWVRETLLQLKMVVGMASLAPNCINCVSSFCTWIMGNGKIYCVTTAMPNSRYCALATRPDKGSGCEMRMHMVRAFVATFFPPDTQKKKKKKKENNAAATKYYLPNGMWIVNRERASHAVNQMEKRTFGFNVKCIT